MLYIIISKENLKRLCALFVLLYSPNNLCMHALWSRLEKGSVRTIYFFHLLKLHALNTQPVAMLFCSCMTSLKNVVQLSYVVNIIDGCVYCVYEYLYMRILPDEFHLKSTVKTIKLKSKLWGRTRIYKYSLPNYRSSYGPG